MSATIITYQTDEQMAAWDTGRAAKLNLFTRLGGAESGRRCPSCSSIVYSRRHELCSVCGEHLPASCRFTAWEARRVESLFETERTRHRAWLRKVCTL
jgi:hypothetical protein